MKFKQIVHQTTYSSYLISLFSITLFWRSSCPQIQLPNKFPLSFGIKAWLPLAFMAESLASATTNEAIASLRRTTDHHTKELQEVRTIQEIHTRTLNEMSQQLTTILQKLSSSDQGGPSQSPRIGENQNPNSALLPVSRPTKLDFPRFFVKNLRARCIRQISILGITILPLERN